MRDVFVGLTALAAHIETLGGDPRMPVAFGPHEEEQVAYPATEAMASRTGTVPTAEDGDAWVLGHTLPTALGLDMEDVLVHLAAPRCIIRLSADPQVSQVTWLDAPESPAQAAEVLCAGLHRATAWLGELDAVAIDAVANGADLVFVYDPDDPEDDDDERSSGRHAATIFSKVSPRP